ncbi:MAG: SDR family oxidoreductase [Caulobacter sp.]|nr:SDR family oxidoreductase [Caulobacter sp.]
MRFEGKVAVITGGAQGMGRTFGEALVREGALVGILDIDPVAGAEAAAALREIGGQAHFATCDVADENSVDLAVADVVSALGGVDFLVNCAAKHLTYYNRPPTVLPRDDWRVLLEVNVIGIVNCAAACRPSMQSRGGGVIINLSSIASFALNGAYGISKLAVRGLTVALAQEFAIDSVRVCGIAPGLVDTPSAISDIPADYANMLIHERQLVKRLGRVQDLVGALFFLCSEDAAFVTGETLIVGGGYPLRA